MTNTNIRPRSILNYYSGIYPMAWKYAAEFRKARGKDLTFWPEWCYMPLAGAHAIVFQEAAEQGLKLNEPKINSALINDIGVIGALAAWRITQGVYRFDPDVYNAVISTPITGDLPHNVFFNLPEWCIYIESPKMRFLNLQLHGFFVYLEFDAKTFHKELRLVLDVDAGELTQPEIPLLKPVIIHLGDWDLAESITKLIEEVDIGAVAKAQNIGINELTPEFIENAAKITAENLNGMLSLIIYICSANGEIGTDDRRPVMPKPAKTKKGLRFFPPTEPKVWDVGVRMGAALRSSLARSEDAQDLEMEDLEGEGRRSPRVHVRRAHWHGYWTGKRNDPADRKFIVKWIPPIIVGNEEDEIPVTIRPVK